MENESFKVGDIVTLKSGSDKMTIDYMSNTTNCHLIWWDFAEKILKKFEDISTASLKKADD